MDFSGFFTINGLVATESFPKISTKAATGGLQLSPGGQGTTLVPLKVVAQTWIFQGPVGSEQHRLLLSPGDLVYVRAEDCTKPWAKAVTLSDGTGTPILLVPIRDVQGINHDQRISVPFETPKQA